MPTLTGAGAIFCAAHEEQHGPLHGHSYEVIAWFEGNEDALAVQCALVEVLKDFDHTKLKSNMAWAESIAEHIRKRMLKCVEVEVRRPLERLYARST